MSDMIDSFYIHNYYMAEIANCIINDCVPLAENSTILFSKNANFQHGVREIIGLYLLIPYINYEKNQLQYDGFHKQLSVYNDETVAFKNLDGIPITIKNLRNTLCHSFVSCELREGEEPLIVFDDRSVMSQSKHSKIENTPEGSKCILVKSSDVRVFLKNAFYELLSNRPEKRS